MAENTAKLRRSSIRRGKMTRYPKNWDPAKNILIMSRRNVARTDVGTDPAGRPRRRTALMLSRISTNQSNSLLRLLNLQRHYRQPTPTLPLTAVRRPGSITVIAFKRRTPACLRRYRIDEGGHLNNAVCALVRITVALRPGIFRINRRPRSATRKVVYYLT